MTRMKNKKKKKTKNNNIWATFIKFKQGHAMDNYRENN